MNSVKYIRNSLETDCHMIFQTRTSLYIRTPMLARMFKAGFGSTIFKDLERRKSMC